MPLTLEAALTKLGGPSRPGALLIVRHDAGESRGDPELLRAAELARVHFASILADRRVAWRELQFVVSGERHTLERSAMALLTVIQTQVGQTQVGLHWQVVLIASLDSDPETTLRCDPGYDLGQATGSVAAWVTPARPPSRYPTVAFLA